MSMPSSSEEVAMSAFSSPAFSRVSALRRCSFERLPWSATCSAPMRSARKRVARSARRRLLTKMSVVRCAWISSASRSYSSSQTSFAMMASSRRSPTSSARFLARARGRCLRSRPRSRERRPGSAPCPRAASPSQVSARHRRLSSQGRPAARAEHQVRAALALPRRSSSSTDHTSWCSSASRGRIPRSTG